MVISYINDRRRGDIKSSRDSTSSDAVRRVERERRHIASVHEDRRKRMHLVREKKNNDNPVQVMVYTSYYSNKRAYFLISFYTIVRVRCL